MDFPLHDGSIASLTPTVCHLLGVKPPHISAEPPLDMIIASLAKDKYPLQKCLIVAPDAIGAHLWQSHERELCQVLPLAPLRVPLRAVFPSKTPVCFASIFTGAQPETHGIQSYSRPVLGCDTFFDALIRAGKKIAIVAVENSSVDLIFRNRDLTYFSEQNDGAVTERTLEVIHNDHHDIIVAYQQDYDDNLHASVPLSPACIQALGQHIQDFKQMAAAANRRWKDKRHVIVFAPDHGAHIDPSSGKGDHGLDIPEDMDLFHCYGIVTEN